MVKDCKTKIKSSTKFRLAWSCFKQPWLSVSVGNHVGKYPTWNYKRLWSKSLVTSFQLKLTETQISYAMTRLVSTAITDVTIPWVIQLVDVVGTTVLHLNEEWCAATVFKPANADFSEDCTVSHCRMISIQPGREVSITSFHRWTCGHHSCACSSLEAIPAIECVVTFIVFCYVVIFSFCICQILVVLTYVN